MTPEEAKTIKVGSTYFQVTSTGIIREIDVVNNDMTGLWDRRRYDAEFLDDRFLTMEEAGERALIVRAQRKLQE